jgi:hypothetical protein
MLYFSDNHICMIGSFLHTIYSLFVCLCNHVVDPLLLYLGDHYICMLTEPWWFMYSHDHSYLVYYYDHLLLCFKINSSKTVRLFNLPSMVYLPSTYVFLFSGSRCCLTCLVWWIVYVTYSCFFHYFLQLYPLQSLAGYYKFKVILTHFVFVVPLLS